MGDKFNSIGGQQQTATGNAKIINNHFTAQKESVAPSGHQKIFIPAPELPPNYLPRQEYLEKFRAALQQESIGLTGAAHVGVQGMGGLGKSVLAIALARDEEVQAAFPDGIFWLTFGQEVKNDDLLAWQNTLLRLLGQQEPEDSLDFGRHRLNMILRDKRCLFIIDDIWDSRHLKCFDLSGTDCRFLLTSRKADVLERLGIEGKPIELLSKEQALAMLARYSAYPLDELPEEAAEIVKECGYLPLAVAAIGSMVKKNRAGRWQLALRKLQEAKLDKIAFRFDYQYENLFRALQVSVEALPEATQQYYSTLAVFPEDANIPESVITMYWEHCAFSDDYPEDMIDALVDASLLTRVDNDSLRLHDLLRDYLIGQAKDIAALHKQLLEAYKAKYSGKWHTIPCEAPFYFHHRWYFHAKAAGEIDQVNIIADDLIKNQPFLNYRSLLNLLKSVDYKFSDIASHLLKNNRHPEVVAACLRILGAEAKEDARRLLKESNQPDILIACLKILGDEAKEDAKHLLKKYDNPLLIATCFGILGVEAKEDARILLKESLNSYILTACLNLFGEDAKDDARRLLKESQHPHVISACLNILGVEAKEDARRLIKESQHPNVLTVCLNILDNEAREDAKRLLKESDDKSVLVTCLNLLGYEAKEDARRFLQEGGHPDVLVTCLNILGYEAKEDAKRLLKENNDKEVISTCLNILGKEAKEDARRLLIESHDADVVATCLKLLGDEVKEIARQMLKENHPPDVLCKCLNLLGEDAKDDARRLLKASKYNDVLTVCLKLLGDEAKDDAKRLLGESKHPMVWTACLKVLGNEAKKDARRLLKSSKDEILLLTCIQILGKEANDDAKRLIKSSKNRSVREACQELLFSWKDTIGGRFPELARLKKNDAEE